MGADANLFVVQNAASTRFIVDEDGDVWIDGIVDAFQHHDDIELLAELEVNLDKSKKLKSKDKYNKKDLEDAKLLSKIAQRAQMWHGVANGFKSRHFEDVYMDL